MMQSYILNAMRRDGPMTAANIEKMYMKATGSKPTSVFIPRMESWGLVSRILTGGYQITGRGLNILESANADDRTMAQPRRLDIFSRESYIAKELTYRGQQTRQPSD